MDIRDYSKEDLEVIFNESSSYAGFLDSIGYSKSGSAYTYTKKYLMSIGIDPNTLIKKSMDSKEKSVEESFVINGSLGTKELKNKILKYGLKDYCCEVCDNKGEWMGNPLSLHLDHINGISNDNRLVNLRFLCPNCHSQTSTYSGKNNKK